MAITYTIHYHTGMSAPTATEKWPSDSSPDRIANMAIADLLSRDGFMLYNGGATRALHYAEACAAFGATRLAGLLQDHATLEKMADRYAPERLPENTANHVDVNVCGIIPLELYLQLGDERYLAAGLELADGQWRDPRPDGLSSQTRFWIDDVWMIGILQVEAYRATGKGIYLERAALEIDAYARKLQRPSGLFTHGEASPHYWGRGNGWVAAGLAEILSVLPESNPHYGSLFAGYAKLMEALRKHQAPDGMWRQLIDREEAWKETSCTGMFGYAVVLGARAGLLPKETYEPVYRKAWLALASYVNERGKVAEVCAGTPQKDDVEFYLQRPRVLGDLHGQASLLWFASALLKD